MSVGKQHHLPPRHAQMNGLFQPPIPPLNNNNKKQTGGGTQTRTASTLCNSRLISDQTPVGVAREDGARQLPRRSVFLAGQPRDTAPLSRPPGEARDEKEAGVAVGGTRPGTFEAGLAHDRGHQGGACEGAHKENKRHKIYSSWG